MKEYLTALQNIDREALKAKAEVARNLAGEYAQQAKTVAGEYAREAKLRAEDALHSPRAEAFAESAKAFASDARSNATDLCAFTTDRVRGFSPFDLAVFKILLVAFGMWLGAWIAAKCSKLAEKFRPILLAGSLCCFAYITYRIFLDQYDE